MLPNTKAIGDYRQVQSIDCHRYRCRIGTENRDDYFGKRLMDFANARFRLFGAGYNLCPHKLNFCGKNVETHKCVGNCLTLSARFVLFPENCANAAASRRAISVKKYRLRVKNGFGGTCKICFLLWMDFTERLDKSKFLSGATVLLNSSQKKVRIFPVKFLGDGFLRF